MPLLVIGAGGHGRVVIEALRAAGHDPAGVVDAVPPPGPVLGLPVLGDEAALPRLRREGFIAAVVAVGENATRQRIGATLAALGFALPPCLHPAAIVSPSARLGAGAVVLARAVLGTGAALGDVALLNTGAIADHDTEIGPAAHLGPAATLCGGVRVGARTLIGAGAAVRPGIRIGADAVVGAGAAVVRDVAEGTRVGGVPARPLRDGAPLRDPAVS